MYILLNVLFDIILFEFINKVIKVSSAQIGRAWGDGR